jgi:hypothetical protein
VTVTVPLIEHGTTMAITAAAIVEPAYGRLFWIVQPEASTHRF